MKIRLETSGGFAGLSGIGGPFFVDTARLQAQDAKEVESLVRDAGFFDLPNVYQPNPGAADFETHVLIVQDDERTHSVEFSDPIENEQLAKLKSAIQRLARRDK